MSFIARLFNVFSSEKLYFHAHYAKTRLQTTVTPKVRLQLKLQLQVGIQRRNQKQKCLEWLSVLVVKGH